MEIFGSLEIFPTHTQENLTCQHWEDRETLLSSFAVKKSFCPGENPRVETWIVDKCWNAPYIHISSSTMQDLPQKLQGYH